MPSTAAPTALHWSTHLKWMGFRALEALSDLRGNAAAGHLEVTPAERPTEALWVFVSTIGELNAIEPLLRSIVAQLPALKLVLITDHAHYRDGFVARYPAAEVCVTRRPQLGRTDACAPLPAPAAGRGRDPLLAQRRALPVFVCLPARGQAPGGLAGVGQCLAVPLHASQPHGPPGAALVPVGLCTGL
jgi:hypothetical protein